MLANASKNASGCPEGNRHAALPASFMYGIRVACVDRVRLSVASQGEHVGLLLPPLNRPLRAVDLDEQVVLTAVRNLTGGDGAESAILKANDRVAVIVELPPRLESFQIARDRFGQQAGHVAAEVVGVRRDVAEATRRAGLAGIGSPRGLLLVARLQSRPQPALM